MTLYVMETYKILTSRKSYFGFVPWVCESGRNFIIFRLKCKKTLPCNIVCAPKIGSPWYFRGKHKILLYIMMSAITYNTALTQGGGVCGKRVNIFHIAFLPS